MPRIPKPTAKMPGMPTQIPARTLATARLVCLLRQRMKETGLAQTKVAAELGINQSLPSKLFHNSFRNVDGQTIETVIQTFGIESRYFSEENLGDNPDYRHFMSGARKKLPVSYAPVKPAVTGVADAAVGELPADVLDEFDMLNASKEERDAFNDIIRTYRFPYINRSLAVAFVSGMRKGRRLHQRVDDALAASIEEEAQKRKATPEKV